MPTSNGELISAFLALFRTETRAGFATMERAEFTTLRQAINGETVIEKQIHGLALPGRYTNAEYARKLL